MRRVLPLALLVGALFACGPRDQVGDDDAGQPSNTDGGSGFLDAGTVQTTVILVRTVIDGDTFIVSAGDAVRTPDGMPFDDEHVRLLGLDAPEIAHPPTPADCYGDEAASYTRSQIGGRAVTLEFDPTHCRPPANVANCRDIYGRILAYVRLGNVVVNEDLLSKGYARVFRGERFVHRDSSKYSQLESAARSADVGLWGACP